KVPQPDDNDDFESDEMIDPREKPMGFFDHLEDLRWTLVKSVGVFLVFAVLIGFGLKEFNEALLWPRSEEHTSELQSRENLVCRLARPSLFPYTTLFRSKVPQPDDNDDFESDEMIDPREKPMGFFDHLEDLRWTLVKSVGVFLVFAVLIGFGLKEFNEALLWPLRSVQGVGAESAVDLGTRSVMRT